jgi:hypothetical protein
MRRRANLIRRALHRAHRDESGKVKFLTIVLLAALVGGAYWGFVYVPLALDHLDVRHRCQESLNSTWRRNSAQHTKDDFLRRVRSIRTVEVEIGGDLRTVPAIDPGEDLEVRLDQSVRPPMLSIDVYYEREVPLPFLDRTHIFAFSTYCERETR